MISGQGFEYHGYATSSLECPECGEWVGKSVGKSAYKHAIGCFRLEDRGTSYHIEQNANNMTERGKRIYAIMQFAAQEREA